MREGSTVGPRISTQLGVLTADCGIPQLAMHSIREMCGTKDIDTGVKIAKAFYREWGTIEKNMKLFVSTLLEFHFSGRFCSAIDQVNNSVPFV